MMSEEFVFLPQDLYTDLPAIPVSSVTLSSSFCLVNFYSSFRAQLGNYFLKEHVLVCPTQPHLLSYELDIFFLPLAPIIMKIIMLLFNICSMFNLSLVCCSFPSMVLDT